MWKWIYRPASVYYSPINIIIVARFPFIKGGVSTAGACLSEGSDISCVSLGYGDSPRREVYIGEYVGSGFDVIHREKTIGLRLSLEGCPADVEIMQALPHAVLT